MTPARRGAIGRRQLLAAAGAAIAAPLLSAPSGFAATPPHRRKVGAFDLTIISDGTLNVPLSFALPETPAAEAAALFAEHGLPASGPPPQTNVSLIRTGNEVVLIDAGSGAHFQPTAGKLAENMEAAGIDPGTITKVVFTHAHADHLWGALDDFDDERFPKASYIIAAPEWDFWTDSNTANKVPDWLKGMARGSARILKRLEGRIERRKPGESVAPGLTYINTVGHTPGHMAVLVGSERQSLMIVGDVLGNAAVSFVRPEWRLGSDHDRDIGVVTRQRVLDQLATDRIPLVGFHLAWPGYGRVERRGAAYRFVPN